MKITIYTATWCGKCQMLKDFYASLQRQHPQHEWLVIDVDEADDADAPSTVPVVSVKRTKYDSPTTFVGFSEINCGLELILDL